MSRLLALLVLVSLHPALRAADAKPMERKTDDRQIIDLLASVHDRGANLFNAGDYAGSFRLFQGSLMTVRLVLPKEIQEQVDRGFARAQLEPNYARRALVLHEVIEDVRKKLHPTAGAVEKLGQPRKADPMGTTDGLRAPETPSQKSPSITETPEPPKAPAAPAASPKSKTEPAPPPVLQSIPTSNPKKPMPPPEAPAPSDALTVPPRPTTPITPMTQPAVPVPAPVTPAGSAPELAPPPLQLPTQNKNGNAPPPLVAPGK